MARGVPLARMRKKTIRVLVGVPAAALLAGSLGLAGCFATIPSRGSIAVRERIAAFPSEALPLHAPATVRWNEQQVPFIEAGDDRDVPLLLGMAHAHLRLAQMELLRKASQARISEMAGPFTADIDATLRALNLGKATPEIKKSMRPDTLAWVERFVEGVNLYRERVRARPADFALMGMDEEPWTVDDVITLGRLASADVNWLLWISYLRLRDQPGWPEAWERLKAFGAAATQSFGPDEPINLVSISKSGSNCFVVSGKRTASGSGLIASDPHVGFMLPALWLVAAYRSPGFGAVSGFMIAGLPMVVVGRNESIAWGGTNMQSLNTSLYDASGEDPAAFVSRTERIRERLWFGREVTVRESPALGPILSDTPFFKPFAGGKTIALKWRGHQPSDEFSAFLDVCRAKTWDDFRAAWRPYAVSGQNMLYADREGNIGQVLALEHQPAAGRTAQVGLGDPKNPEHRWGPGIGSTDLPAAHNPEAGFLVSTNNTPVRVDPPVTLKTNANDRHDRLASLLAASDKIDFAAAGAMQLDVYSRWSHDLARSIAARAADINLIGGGRALTLLESWDGFYAIDSLGAPILQAVARRLALGHYSRRYSPAVAEFLLGSEAVFTMLREDVEAGRLDNDLAGALSGAEADIKEGTRWGDVHFLKIAMPVSRLPLFGSKFDYGTIPVPGSLTTVFKAANRVGPGPHFADYGANARHIADMSSPDENYFVLMGGQDGWIGSTTVTDQVPLWREGRFIRVPLSEAKAREAFPFVTELTRK